MTQQASAPNQQRELNRGLRSGQTIKQRRRARFSRAPADRQLVDDVLADRACLSLALRLNLPVITCDRGRSSSDQPPQTNSRDPGSGNRKQTKPTANSQG